MHPYFPSISKLELTLLLLDDFAFAIKQRLAISSSLLLELLEEFKALSI